MAQWEKRAEWFKKGPRDLFMRQMLELKPEDYLSTVAKLLETNVITHYFQSINNHVTHTISLSNPERANAFVKALHMTNKFNMVGFDGFNRIYLKYWMDIEDTVPLNKCPFNVTLTFVVGLLSVAFVKWLE